MRDLESRIRAVVRRRTPKGWTVRETCDSWSGMADPFTKKIHCPPLHNRHALLIFLHEVAHVVLGHCDDPTVPTWRKEYEAERWATDAARGDGIAVPISYLGGARYDVACHIEKAIDKDPDLEVDDDALTFAFPDSWRHVRDGEPLKKAA